MEEWDDYHRLVGETLMYCQTIEHDIKAIDAGMLEGDYDQNSERLKKKTLGQTLQLLRKLDESDGKPEFSAKDYDLLEEITEIRNNLCQRSYLSFVYSERDTQDADFQAAFRDLESQNERLSSLRDQVETIRLEILKKFHRY